MGRKFIRPPPARLRVGGLPPRIPLRGPGRALAGPRRAYTGREVSAAASETVVHPTAVVLPGAELGAGVEVGPYCVVEPGAEIGEHSRLLPHVHVLGRTSVGPRCVLGTGSVLGGEPQDRKFDGGRGQVRLGEGCRLFEHCTVHRPTNADGETVVGDRVMMMAGSHVGHNGRVGDDVVMVNNAAVGGHGHVGRGAFLSLASAVHQFTRVGRLTLVAGYALVTRDAPPFSIVAGAYPLRWRAPNSIGLRRAGVDAATRDALRRAMVRLFLSNERAQEVARELAGNPVPEVAELAEFLLSSRRGFCSGLRDEAFETPLDEGIL